MAYVFTNHGTRYPGQYRKVWMKLGEPYFLRHYTGYTKIATLKNVFKNGNISVDVDGKTERYTPNSDGRLHLNILDNAGSVLNDIRD